MIENDAPEPGLELPPRFRPRCTRHPGAFAGWRCDDCDAALCPRCAGAKRMSGTVLVLCATCHALANPITVHREAIAYPIRLRQAWRYPLTRDGLITWLGLAGVLWITMGIARWGLGPMKPVVALGAWSLFWSYVVALTHRSGHGDPRIESFRLSEIVPRMPVAGLVGSPGTELEFAL